jgi:hypothetical protein
LGIIGGALLSQLTIPSIDCPCLFATAFKPRNSRPALLLALADVHMTVRAEPPGELASGGHVVGTGTGGRAGESGERKCADEGPGALTTYACSFVHFS